MLVEKLKEVSTLYSWTFNYGADFYQNLQDLPDDADADFDARTKYLMLINQDITDNIVNGFVQSQRYDGNIVFAVRSRFTDPDYNHKYETHIKNLQIEIEKLKLKLSTCGDWGLIAWKTTEVADQYDTNLDGIRIQFTIEYNG